MRKKSKEYCIASYSCTCCLGLPSIVIRWRRFMQGFFFDPAFFSGAHERPPLRLWGVDTCGAFRPLWHAAFVLRDTFGCVGGSRTAVLPSAAKASRVLGVSSPLLSCHLSVSVEIEVSDRPAYAKRRASMSLQVRGTGRVQALRACTSCSCLHSQLDREDGS